jgi:predicted ATPase
MIETPHAPLPRSIGLNRINALSIEGFKSFEKRSVVRLAPITLIFGENSVGKSTLIQALMLRAQTGVGNYHNAPKTDGRLIDFGPAKSTLLGKKRKLKKFVIGVGVEVRPWWIVAKKLHYELSDYELGLTNIMQEEAFSAANVSENNNAHSLRLVDQNYCFSRTLEPILEITRLKTKWKIKNIFNDEEFFDYLGELWVSFFKRVNENEKLSDLIDLSSYSEVHPALWKLLHCRKTAHHNDEVEGLFSKEEAWTPLKKALRKIPGGLSHTKWLKKYRRIEGALSKEEKVPDRRFIFSYENINTNGDSFFSFGDKAPDIDTFLDDQLNPSHDLHFYYGYDDEFTQRGGVHDDELNYEYMLDALFEDTWLGYLAPRPNLWQTLKQHTDEELDDCFKNLLYLSSKRPLFEMNTIFWANQDEASRHFQEGLSLDALSHNLYFMPGLLTQVNDWLEKLSANFVVEARHDGQHEFYFFRAVSRDREWETTLDNIGSGLQQLIPVVTQAVGTKNKIMLVEEPETHLHPRFQRELADFFLEYQNKNEHQFILETHSEPMVHRLLELVRSGELSPEDLAIVYVSADEHGSHAKNFEVDEEGEFVGGWPEELFPVSY